MHPSTTRHPLRPLLLCLALACGTASAQAGDVASPITEAASPTAPATRAAAAAERTGLQVYEAFRAGLADPDCGTASARWSQHFAHAPRQLASGSGELLPLFGYVVDALREADLPTEYALIPFVESGYKPAARSPQGPAGLWQMITITARNHRVPIHAGYDGRLSPVDSTRAAVRYLKTLHGMFAGDWRLAVMAYNAGEYRVLGALKRSGQVARDARPEQLVGIPDITHAYVRKLQALSCLLAQADDRDDWRRALDRPMPRLQAFEVEAGTPDIATWARRNGQDPALVARLNPAFTGGRIVRTGAQPPRLLAVDDARVGAVQTRADADIQISTASVAPTRIEGAAAASPASAGRRHTVAPGDSAWTIARRYGIAVEDLLQRNDLHGGSVLRPGRVLAIDAPMP